MNELEKRRYQEIFYNISKINKKLNKYDYGMLNNGKKFTNQLNGGLYRTITPKDFEKYKIGVCWDFANYQSYWFDKNCPEVYYKLYYLEWNNCDNTHTFLAFKWIDRKWYIFESCWVSHQGIFPFRSEEEMLNYYIDELMINAENKGYALFSYKRTDEEFKNGGEFVDYIINNGKLERDNYDYYNKRIRPYLKSKK